MTELYAHYQSVVYFFPYESSYVMFISCNGAMRPGIFQYSFFIAQDFFIPGSRTCDRFRFRYRKISHFVFCVNIRQYDLKGIFGCFNRRLFRHTFVCSHNLSHSSTVSLNQVQPVEYIRKVLISAYGNACHNIFQINSRRSLKIV